MRREKGSADSVAPLGDRLAGGRSLQNAEQPRLELLEAFLAEQEDAAEADDFAGREHHGDDTHHPTCRQAHGGKKQAGHCEQVSHDEHAEADAIAKRRRWLRGFGLGRRRGGPIPKEQLEAIPPRGT